MCQMGSSSLSIQCREWLQTWNQIWPHWTPLYRKPLSCHVGLRGYGYRNHFLLHGVRDHLRMHLLQCWVWRRLKYHCRCWLLLLLLLLLHSSVKLLWVGYVHLLWDTDKRLGLRLNAGRSHPYNWLNMGLGVGQRTSNTSPTTYTHAMLLLRSRERRDCHRRWLACRSCSWMPLQSNILWVHLQWDIWLRGRRSHLHRGWCHGLWRYHWDRTRCAL